MKLEFDPDLDSIEAMCLLAINETVATGPNKAIDRIRATLWLVREARVARELEDRANAAMKWAGKEGAGTTKAILGMTLARAAEIREGK